MYRYIKFLKVEKLTYNIYELNMGEFFQYMMYTIHTTATHIRKLFFHQSPTYIQ